MIRIWTDGCCSTQAHGREGPGGWAFVAWRAGAGVVERRSGALPFADSGRMELLAVLEAVRWADGKGPLEVFTDAHYVASGFDRMDAWRRDKWRRRGRKNRLRSLANADLWQTLWALSRRGAVTITHIRRAIHVYNVEADQAAKQAMRYEVGPRTRTEQLLMHAIDNTLRGNDRPPRRNVWVADRIGWQADID